MDGAALRRRAAVAVLAAAGHGAVYGCGAGNPKSPDAIGSSPSHGSDAPDYAYDSLDEHPVRAGALRGKPTVLAFVSTFDLKSQAQVDYLAGMAKNDGDSVNYAIIALEPPANRELVEAFRRFVDGKFGVTLLAALGDAETTAGAGPFGDVHVVPTLVVLDAGGRVAWRKVGLATSEEIRAALPKPSPGVAGTAAKVTLP